MELDKETQKMLSDGEKIADFVNSSAWKLVKDKLVNRLITLDSISSMPTMDKDEFYVQAKIREGVVSIITEWIRDIEGDAEKHKSNKQAFSSMREEVIIEHFE